MRSSWASLMLLSSRHSRAPRRAPSAGAQSQAFTSPLMRMRRQILHGPTSTLAVCPLSLACSGNPSRIAGNCPRSGSGCADRRKLNEPFGAPAVMDDIFSASKPRSLKRALSRQARPSVRRHTKRAKRHMLAAAWLLSSSTGCHRWAGWTLSGHDELAVCSSRSGEMECAAGLVQPRQAAPARRAMLQQRRSSRDAEALARDSCAAKQEAGAASRGQKRVRGGAGRAGRAKSV
jgi:hypothetical protein